MSPEFTPDLENPLTKWGNEVKEQIKKGKATGSMTAEANFDLKHDGFGPFISPREDVDYGAIFLQGGVSDKEENEIYFDVAKVKKTNNIDDLKHPDTLYITIMKPTLFSPILNTVGGDRSVIEIAYRQYDPTENEDTNRDLSNIPNSGKWIHLIVSDGTATEFQKMVYAGVDPNQIHDTIADIFTDKDQRKYFDAKKVDLQNSDKILVTSEIPKFEKTHISSVSSDNREAVTQRTIQPITRWWIEYNEPQSAVEDTKKQVTTKNLRIPTPEPSEATKPMKPIGQDIENTQAKARVATINNDLEKTMARAPQKEVHEFQIRMKDSIIKNLNGKFNDKNLLTYILDLAKRPNTSFNIASLEKEQRDLITGMSAYDPKELGVVLGVISDMIEERKKKTKVGDTVKLKIQRQPGGDREEFVDMLAEAIHGKGLSQDEKYLELLKGEEWNNSPQQPINPENAPGYYIEMIGIEKDAHNLRIELDNNAFTKRNGLTKPTLEALSAEIKWAGFEKGETKVLYKVPGVKRALEILANLAVNDPAIFTRVDGSRFSLRTAKSKGEIQTVREFVRDEIASTVADDFKRISSSLSQTDQAKWNGRGLLNLDPNSRDKTLSFKCRDAEQIAFNLLYLGGFFESVDSQWVNGVRVRPPQIATALVSPAIKDSMNPLDSLIDTLGKDPASRPLNGTIDRWASNQTLKSNNGRPLSNIDRVLIVDTNKGSNKNLFWTIHDGGRTLWAPECYPTKLVKSVWEETTTDTSKRTILSYLIAGEEVPWDEIKGEGMWGSYGSKLGKAGTTLTLLQGGTSIRWGEYENTRLWAEAVENALAKFGRKQEIEVKRWVLYASNGINPNKREPVLNNSNIRLDILGNLGPGRADYLPKSDLLFPWDKHGKFLI